MGNFKRTTVVAVIALAVFIVAGVLFFFPDRPIRRVSLPPGTEFPACLVDDPKAQLCKDIVRCLGEAQGGLTYNNEIIPLGAHDKRWCCPFGSHVNGIPDPARCVVEVPKKP
jgi:hypothetical protein